MTENPNNGHLLMPVCLPDGDATDILSALDLYRVLGFGGQMYPQFKAVLDAIPYIADPDSSPCLDIGAGSSGFNCETFDTHTEAMHFYPNDPFVGGSSQIFLNLQWMRYADVLDMIEVPEWLEIVRDTIGLELIGYELNDIILVPDVRLSVNPIVSLENLLDQFTSFPLPTITIVTEGSGTIGIEFLNVPLGGRALVLRDIDLTLQEIYEVITDTVSQGNEGILNSLSLVELNRDLTSIPQETASTQVQEYEFTEEDTNTLRIVFIPAFNDEIPFLFPFGGIRSFRACGNVKVKSFTDTTRTISRHSTRTGAIGIMSEQDVYNALIRYQNQVSKRWLLGFTPDNYGGGIDIDPDDGTITGGSGIKLDSTGGFLGNKPNIPATIDEVVYGGAMGVGRGFKDLIGDIILRRIDQSRTAQNVADILRGFFFFRGLVDGIDLFGQALGTPLVNATDQVTPVVNAEEIARLVYCFGANKQALFRYALAVEDANGTDAVDIANFYRSIIEELEDQQITQWYNEGQLIPDLGYSSAPCYRNQTRKANIDLAQLKNNSSIYYQLFPDMKVKPANNIWRIEFTGVWDNTATNERLTVMHKRLANQSWTSTSVFIRYYTSTGFGGSADFIPPADYPTPNSGGKYVFEFTKPAERAVVGFQFTVPAWDMANVVTVEQGTITVSDLGVI